MTTQRQRSYTRWLHKRIYKTEIKFWAVLDCQGCREKKTKYATFSGGFFNSLGPNKNLKFFLCPQKVEKPTPKSCRLMAVGSCCFSLCSPDCPKQPRTSFPFYKFFYPTISCKISDRALGFCESVYLTDA